MRALIAFIVILSATPATAQDQRAVPACRLDDTYKVLVGETIERSLQTYEAIGKPLRIKRVELNRAASEDTSVLNVLIVQDAAVGKVSPQGCVTTTPLQGDQLDPISVRGGCVVVAIERMEMRCSSAALKVFGAAQGSRRANPALLYVLSHELAHVHQKRAGEYSGGVERIELKADRAGKLGVLRDACDPVSHRREEEADALALEILTRLLADSPYRETTFSERGSLYWNIDQLALASNAWQKHLLERELGSQPATHASFNPTEFPAPARMIESNAKRFVCEVLTKRSGTFAYPGRSATHPPLEQRLRRMAEALRPVAERLPATGAQTDFAPIARLQQDVSPILTHIYRETGVYLEAVQSRICSIVNQPKPEALCR